MKTIKLLGLLTLIASSVASANTAITFPGEGSSVPNAPVTFPTSSKTPITFLQWLYHQRWDFPFRSKHMCC